MSGNLEAYKKWAPDGALWTDWVKPALFAEYPKLGFSHEPIEIPELKWISQRENATAIIVDLPGKSGALEGMALARLGWRPVPLYNGVCGPKNVKAAVPSHEIALVLQTLAGELSRMRIRDDAPPAFLLDSDRMDGKARIGDYDNRWSVFPQDMPSAAYLINHGIRRVIVRSEVIEKDLAHVLLRYETQGIAILLNDGFAQKTIPVPRPSKFKSLFYRACVLAGLRRNSAGGFGEIVPEPSSSGGRG